MALEPYEAVLVQFSILRNSLGLGPGSPPPRPASHPHKTFEWCLPLQMGISDRRSPLLDDVHLIRPPTSGSDTSTREYIYECHFCRTLKQTWSHIDAYWIHLRDRHDDVPREDIIEAVRASGRRSREWQASRGYNYTRKIDDMITQSMHETFNWEMFQGWKLHSRTARAKQVSRRIAEHGLREDDEQFGELEGSE